LRVSAESFTQLGGKADSSRLRFGWILQRNSDDSTFLSWVITGEESWIYCYGPETKKQSSQWERPNSLRPKKAREVNSKDKSMFIILFDIKGTVHKEFVLAGQTINC
jgi:hypothetical protein